MNVTHITKIITFILYIGTEFYRHYI